jgi:hypothetical protein
MGGRRALFVEFEGWKAHFVAVVGSRKALHIMIMWIKSLCMVVSLEAQFLRFGRQEGPIFEFEGCKAYFIVVIGSRRALLIVIV